MADPETAPVVEAAPEAAAAAIPTPVTPPPPAHPARQPIHFGRPRPAPHRRPTHEQVMKRPAEHLHLAKHHMHPHPDQSESNT
jgi:hypothetical protein